MKHYQYISKSNFLPLVTKFYLNKKNPEKILTYNFPEFPEITHPWFAFIRLLHRSEKNAYGLNILCRLT